MKGRTGGVLVKSGGSDRKTTAALVLLVRFVFFFNNITLHFKKNIFYL